MLKDFATLIHEERVKQGISQQALAEVAGCTDTAIRNYETGKRYPNILVAHKILTYLGINFTLGEGGKNHE